MQGLEYTLLGGNRSSGWSITSVCIAGSITVGWWSIQCKGVNFFCPDTQESCISILIESLQELR